jgi:hypothetical protein
MFQGFTSAIIVAGEIKDEAMEVRKEPNPGETFTPVYLLMLRA